jgi:uncharacterized protein Veg
MLLTQINGIESINVGVVNCLDDKLSVILNFFLGNDFSLAIMIELSYFSGIIIRFYEDYELFERDAFSYPDL